MKRRWFNSGIVTLVAILLMGIGTPLFNIMSGSPEVVQASNRKVAKVNLQKYDKDVFVIDNKFVFKAPKNLN